MNGEPLDRHEHVLDVALERRGGARSDRGGAALVVAVLGDTGLSCARNSS